MSSREPFWFCHGCHAEMTPLMVPDPVCASCRSEFVEKMESLEDDPRTFTGRTRQGDMDDPSFDPILIGIQALIDRQLSLNSSPPQGATRNPSHAFSFQINDQNGLRTIRLGSGAQPNRGDEDHMPPPSVPNMTTFLHSGPQGDQERPTIGGTLMAQYLMAMLGNQSGTMFGMPGNGTMGDYVFNQEALDQIMTQIMENSNAHRPVPATEEIIENLPREVLMEESPTLEKDCAVCKEQFKLGTEDPDEQVVVTLPCSHPFHETCILPWLKSSGTCPVCRHALVPQPEHHALPPRPGSGSDGGGSSSDRNTRGSPNQSGPSGLFQSFFSAFPGHSNPSSQPPRSGYGYDRNTPSQRPASSRRRSDPPQPPRENNNRDQFPGGWSEDVD